jgi:hypothetical protein
MTKQQKTYGLLFAVLVIWGTIGYQVYNRLNPPIPELKLSEIQTQFQRKKIKEQSFYELKKTYRDPFLGSFPIKKVVRKQTLVSKKAVTPFPNVKYNGIIEGNHKSYIFTVNGQQEIIKIGEVFQGIKLLKATKNEVKVKFENRIKTFVKQ